jgi:hypothetical protein
MWKLLSENVKTTTPIPTYRLRKIKSNCRMVNVSSSLIINEERCTCEIKSRTAIERVTFNKKTLLTSKLDLHLTKNPVKCQMCSTDLYGVETWTLQKIDQKYPESFKMWYAVLHSVKEERNILHTKNKGRLNVHILHRKSLLTHIITDRWKG